MQTFREEILKLQTELEVAYPEVFKDERMKLLERFRKRQHEEDIIEARMDIVQKIEDLARGVKA